MRARGRPAARCSPRSWRRPFGGVLCSSMRGEARRDSWASWIGNAASSASSGVFEADDEAGLAGRRERGSPALVRRSGGVFCAWVGLGWVGSGSQDAVLPRGSKRSSLWSVARSDFYGLYGSRLYVETP